MKLVISFVMVLFLFVGSICFAQEHLLLSALSTNKELLVFHVVYANKKYTVVDRASFNLPVQGGTTAIAPLPNDRYQVLWTTGPATARPTQALSPSSTNAPIKIKYLIVDSDLNQIGNIKTLGPTLSSHVNFNHIPAPTASSSSTKAGMLNSDVTKMSFQVGKNVVLKNRNGSTGALFGDNFWIGGTVGAPVHTIDIGFNENNYAGVRYDENSGTYSYLCGFIDASAPIVTAAFTGDIINSTVLPIPNSDDFNFMVLKRLNNPERIGIDNFQIESENCRPIKTKIITPPARQNLGQLGFFGGIASTLSLISQNGGHLAVIRSEADGGVDIHMRHVNILQGTGDSPFSDLSVDEINAGVDQFIYGLAMIGLGASDQF